MIVARPSFVGATTTGINTGTIALTPIPGVAVGDTLVLVGITQGTGPPLLNVDPSWGSPINSLFTTAPAQTSGGLNGQVHVHRWTGAETAAFWNVTITGSHSSAASILAYRGCDAVYPSIVGIPANNTASPVGVGTMVTNSQYQPLQTVNAGTMLLFAMAQGGGSNVTACNPPTNSETGAYTQRGFFASAGNTNSATLYVGESGTIPAGYPTIGMPNGNAWTVNTTQINTATLALLLIPPTVSSVTQIAATGTNQASGLSAPLTWTFTQGNVTADDDARAQTTSGNARDSNCLRATFAFSIPTSDGYSIVGHSIETRLRAFTNSSPNGRWDLSYALTTIGGVNNGLYDTSTLQSHVHTLSAPLSQGNDTSFVWGGFGFNWNSFSHDTSPNIINDSLWGFNLIASQMVASPGGTVHVEVDSMWMTEYYWIGTEASTPVRGNAVATGASTVAAAGVARRKATGAATGASTVAAAGVMRRKGTGHALGSSTVAATAILNRVASLTATLGNVVLDSAVSNVAGAALTTTLGNVALSSATQVLANGQLARTLGDVALAGSAGQVAKATLTATLDNAPLFSSVAVLATATLNRTLGPVTVASSATAIANAALDRVLQNVGFSAFASFPPVIGLSQMLQNVTLDSAGSIGVSFSLNQILDAVTLVGAIQAPANAALARTLDATTLTGLGAQVNHYTLTQTLVDLSLVGIVNTFTPSSARNGSMYALLNDVVTTSASTTTITGRVNQTLEDITITDVIDVPATVMGILSLNPAVLFSSVTLPCIGRLNVTLKDSPSLASGGVPATGGVAQTLGDVALTSAVLVPAIATLAVTLDDVAFVNQTSIPISGACAAKLDDLVFANNVDVFTLVTANIILGNVRLASQVIAAAINTLDVVLADVTLQGRAVVPEFATLTATLQALAFSGAINALATGKATPTLENVVGDLEADVPATAGAVTVLDGLALVATGGAVIEGRHTTVLDNVVLTAGSFVETDARLNVDLDEMFFSGYMLHVVRTPVLHVNVDPRYVFAQVSTDAIHVEVETTFAIAMLTADFQDKAA